MGAGKKGRNNDLSGVGPIRSLTILLYQNVGLACHCCILVDISVQSVYCQKFKTFNRPPWVRLGPKSPISIFNDLALL